MSGGRSVGSLESQVESSERVRNESISASIVILAGVSAVTACGFIRHEGTQIFIGLVGGSVTFVGFSIWFRLLRLKDEE